MNKVICPTVKLEKLGSTTLKFEQVYNIAVTFKGHDNLLCSIAAAREERADTDLLRPAHRQCVEVIRLLGVMIRAHFVDIESHIVPLFVCSRPARQRTQDQDAVRAYYLLPAGLSGSFPQLHVSYRGGGW